MSLITCAWCGKQASRGGSYSGLPSGWVNGSGWLNGKMYCSNSCKSQAEKK